MSEVAVTTLAPHAWPNKDNPKVLDDTYFIRSHELKDALNKGFVRFWEAGDAVPAPSGYREMPLVVIDNFDGDNFNLSNGWVRFEGDFLAGDVISIHGIKWDPVEPITNPPEFQAVGWGFNHVVAADGDGVVTAADVVASFVSQANINGEAIDNRCRVFSSLVVDGGKSPGFSMHRGGVLGQSIVGSGSFRYPAWPDYPNVENQYEGVYPKAVPPLPKGGGQTPPPVTVTQPVVHTHEHEHE